jgi:peptidyl carrier protein
MTNDGDRTVDKDGIVHRVTTIWRDVLGVGAERDDATFFELSGQSITATLIIARIEDELGIALDIGDLFEDPDLPEFVAKVVAAAASNGDRKPAV